MKLSFQEWTQQVQDMINTKKFGDIAFKDKDFKNAVEYYSKVHDIDNLALFIVFLKRFRLNRVSGNAAGVDDACAIWDGVCETSPLVSDDRASGASTERCNAGPGLLA